MKPRSPMLSQREVERKYRLLKIEPAEQNKINCYTCRSCGHITKTVDLHEGTTPMIIGCELCANEAHSSGYKDINPGVKPSLVWLIPTLKECFKMRKDPAMLEHIFAGGLKLFNLKEKPDDKNNATNCD